MSYPYYYQPQYLYATPYLYPYAHPAHVSPFIPQAPLPPSPRSPPRHVRFDDPLDDWDRPQQTRQRRTSFHTTTSGLNVPPVNPGPFLTPPLLYGPLPPIVQGPPRGDMGHHRTYSDSAMPQPAWFVPYVPAAPVYQQPVVKPELHPLLSGEGSTPLLLFDFSSHAFNPQRITALGRTSGTPLTLEELGQRATNPITSTMTIVCDVIPQWPISLQPHTTERTPHSPFLSVPENNQPQPTSITVRDVLAVIHASLQKTITHLDWARLSMSETTAIARAYTRRCRTFPSVESFEAAQGVRRVDYLLQNYMFKGLVRQSGAEGFERIKLIVGPK